LQCLDLATGHVVWRDNLLVRYNVPEGSDDQGIAWGRSGSPLIVDELIVVPAGGPARGKKVSLAAFHAITGDLVWEAGESQISYSSPILTTLANVRQVISVNEADVSGHDPQSGTLLWKFEWTGHSTSDANCSQPVPIGVDRLFVSKGYLKGAALWQLKRSEAGSLRPEELWHEPTVLKTKFTNVVVYQDHVYGLSDGTLECVELAAGQRRWKQGRYGHGQILGVGDLILVLAENGELALVEASPERYRELARIEALPGKTWNNLCLAGNRLFIRNAEEAACYELVERE
jgi:outer membrane protein assembly factor BamB